VLARSLYNHFTIALSDDDYEEGMEILDRILTFCGSGDEPSPSRVGALVWAALFADDRFEAYGKPEHLEHAIYHCHTLLDGISVEDSDRAVFIALLSHLEELCLVRTANTQDVLSIFPKSKLPLSRDLIASLPEAMPVKLNPETYKKHVQALYAFTTFTDVASIKDGIKYCQLLLVSYPHSELASTAQVVLGALLHLAFECTHKIEYLNKAISAARDGINTADSLHPNVRLFIRLISSLSTCLVLLRQEGDFYEIMQLSLTAADLCPLISPHKPLLSSGWATIARRFGHPSASTAYDRAMSSIQASLTFAPTLDSQHSQLVAMHDILYTILLHYASYQIHTGHLEQAIKTLK